MTTQFLVAKRFSWRVWGRLGFKAEPVPKKTLLLAEHFRFCLQKIGEIICTKMNNFVF